MKIYRVETKILNNGELVLDKLPFNEGDTVEITVRKHDNCQHYPLRGKPVIYKDPFGSVAEDDWDAPR